MGKKVIQSLDNDLKGYGAIPVNDYVGLSGQVQGLTTSMAESLPQTSLKLFDRLQSGLVTKIKLIGDSITEGVGATGHTVPGSNPVIFDDGAGAVFHEGDYTSPSFANFFRNYIQSAFPSIQFTNAGIGGKSAKWANANKQYWVSDTEDVVFVQLGTNDRWDNTDINGFKSDITNFLDYVNQRSNLMIVLTATPTLNDYKVDGSFNSTDYKFGMRDVDTVITELCKEKGYLHISNYRDVLNFAKYNGMPLDNLLQTFAVGSHPIDKGHLAIWQNIQQRLGLIDKTTNWNQLNGVYALYRDQTLVMNSTPLNNSFFTIGGWSVFEISGTHPDVANFPEGQTGTLRTYRGFAHDQLYNYQEYLIRQTSKIYVRYWNYSTQLWTAWTLLPNYSPARETFTFTSMTVAANSQNNIYLTPTKFTVVSSSVYAISPQVLIPAGLVFAGYRLDGVSNRIYLAYQNVTASPITITSMSVNISEVTSH